MPNVLIEVGFLSNKQEAYNLSKAYYRRQIAESIFQAIVDFKIKYEKPILK
jgi:N-acetylmuramoyl-L-alanine amidase